MGTTEDLLEGKPVRGGKGATRVAATPAVGWLNTEQAVTYLALPSAGALYQLVRRGRLRASHIGRSLRFRVQDLDACVEPGFDLTDVSEGLPS